MRRSGAPTEIEILEKLATTYVLLFDQRAIETYETLVALAGRTGRVDDEARALIDLSLTLASVSCRRYVEVLERALDLSEAQTGSPERAGTRISCLARRMAAAGWNSQDAEECRKSIAEARRTGNRLRLAATLIDFGFVQWISSQYREAHSSATESIEILIESGEENPYLSVAHWLCHRSLLLLGRWGEASRAIEAAIARVDQNGDRYRMHTLRLQRAWLHLNAMDFEGVRATCETMFPVLPAVRSPSGMRVCQILAGSAEMALGNHERGLEYLLAARDGMDREALIFDWYWRMPLESGLTELWLAKGDLDRARPQAERFLQTTLATAERTWQALAWETRSRVAALESDLARARTCMAEALCAMEGFDVPLAAWRVHATASELYRRLGEARLADCHRDLSRATILTLADSLEPESRLRKTFLTAPPIAKIL